jgi:hypothetical protein
MGVSSRMGGAAAEQQVERCRHRQVWRSALGWGREPSVFTCTHIYIGMTRPVSTGTLTALLREEVRVGGRVPQIPEGPRLRKHQKIGSSWCTDGPELVLLLQLQCGLWLVALGSP